jgi:hypothetical protein
LIFDSDPRKAINLGIKNKLNRLLYPTDLLHGVRASVTKSARRMRCGCHGVSCWMPAPGNRPQATGHRKGHAGRRGTSVPYSALRAGQDGSETQNEAALPRLGYRCG